MEAQEIGLKAELVEKLCHGATAPAEAPWILLGQQPSEKPNWLARFRRALAEIPTRSADRALFIGMMNQTRAADRLLRHGWWHLALREYEQVLDALNARATASEPVPEAGVAFDHGAERSNSDPTQSDDEEQLQQRVDRMRAQILQRSRAQLQAVAPGAFLTLPLNRWWRAGAIVLLLFVVFAAHQWRIRDIGVGATWSWVNRANGSVTRGTLAKHAWLRKGHNYFFHTECAGNPMIDVDLGAEHLVSRVSVVNRLDCCQERARALEVLTSRDGKGFALAKGHDRNQDFIDWDAQFSARRARYIRLQVPAVGCLHLSEIRVFGR